MIMIFEPKAIAFIRINFAMYSFLTNKIFNGLNVYNFYVYNYFNIYNFKSAKGYINLKIIS